MSTSDRDRVRRAPIAYLAASVGCGLCSIIYERFSHGVTSPYMVWLFLIPLLCGALPFTLIVFSAGRCPSRASRSAWHCGVATLALGSFMTGVFEIYGTTAPLVRVYWYAGALLCFIGLAIFVFGGNGRRNKDPSSLRSSG